MRRSFALAAMLALVVMATAAAPTAARPPIALGVSNAASTDMAALDEVTAGRHKQRQQPAHGRVRQS